MSSEKTIIRAVFPAYAQAEAAATRITALEGAATHITQADQRFNENMLFPFGSFGTSLYPGIFPGFSTMASVPLPGALFSGVGPETGSNGFILEAYVPPDAVEKAEHIIRESGGNVQDE